MVVRRPDQVSTWCCGLCCSNLLVEGPASQLAGDKPLCPDFWEGCAWRSRASVVAINEGFVASMSRT